MKSLVCSALFVLISSTAATAAPNIRCYTPTTSIEVVTEKDRVNVEVMHHYGSRFTPLFNGLVSPFQLQKLGEQAQRIEKLGKTVNFYWPLKNCKISDDRLFTCSQGEPQKVGDVTIRPVSLSSYKIATETVEYKFEKIAISIKFLIGTQVNEIHMDYAQDRCF